MLYRFKVTETIAHVREYVVEASNETEATEKAEIGDTIEENDLHDQEVIDRNIVEGPDPCKGEQGPDEPPDLSDEPQGSDPDYQERLRRSIQADFRGLGLS